ncbi:polysaccharide pyruvyl transferase family protein [Nostoc sp. FACHB-152]|uniref:polysaccharide pyruvyl transferase family protein n=1 Tax=unclassified Nostoc TaxID=2593658 RepID=UPI001682AF1E|nr:MULTISPECIES: polysaccharide pyruvyl transferase family protein [unclassified Nostoc]MBD2448765.1 polysaccharide pyruvyl transferase family protein [Nostoc sp. FACHB-152]MBD2467544.1 polysaccharide pyruvyl transferase family protein [Nostoc sp. FACHB-145]
MARKKEVVICGFYGNHNLGDEAMLVGMINLLQKQQNDLSFTVFSNDPQDTKSRYSVQSIHRYQEDSKIKRLLKILQSSYFVLGGGDLLRDSVQYPIVPNWLGFLQQALKFRRRTLVIGISVGDIWKPESKVLIPQVLNKVDFLAVRDIQSKKKLEELGVSNSIYVMSDLALQAIPETLSQSTRSTNQPLQVGISVRHLTGRGKSVDVDIYNSLQKEIAALADFLVEKYGAIVHFLPFRTHQDSYHPTDDDYVSILSLLRYSHHSAKFVVHRNFESLHKLNTLISTLDLMIGMRLHSLILSAGLGVPIIAAEYDPKVHGFMEEIGHSPLSIPLEYFDQARLIPLIDKILQDPLTARLNIAAGVKNYRQRMEEVEIALKQLFSSNS